MESSYETKPVTPRPMGKKRKEEIIMPPLPAPNPVTVLKFHNNQICFLISKG